MRCVNRVANFFVLFCLLIGLSQGTALAATAKGKITGTILNKADGQPVSGLLVQAWDQDKTGSQLMGKATTGKRGEYSISFEGKNWDPKECTDKMACKRPDVYITVSAKEGQTWKEIYKSSVKKDVVMKTGAVFNAKIVLKEPPSSASSATPAPAPPVANRSTERQVQDRSQMAKAVGLSAALMDMEKLPSFKAKFKANDIRRRNLSKIQLDRGVKMDFETYMKETSLPNTDDLKPLFQADIVSKHFKSRPTYNEDIRQFDDRIIVEREMTIELKPDACQNVQLSKQRWMPRALTDLCLKRKKNGKLSKDELLEVAELRKSLNEEPDKQQEIAPGLTVERALKLNDSQLYELVLNGDTRVITSFSNIPLVAYNEKPTLDRRQFSVDEFQTRQLQRSNFSSQKLTRRISTNAPKRSLMKGATEQRRYEPNSRLSVAGNLQRAPVSTSQSQSTSSDSSQSVTSDDGGVEFETQYFLTGFTIGNRFADVWELTLAKKRWWHPRYFVRFSYELGAGFGLRMPFSIEVEAGAESQTSPGTRPVSVKVSPEDVDKSNLTSFREVGLDQTKYFDGREFVLEVTAMCGARIRVPGYDHTFDCPIHIDKKESRDFPPVLGTTAHSEFASAWLLDGKDVSLGYSWGAIAAYVDLGAALRITNGVFKMNAQPLNADLSVNNSSPAAEQTLSFGNQRTTQLSVKRKQSGGYGFLVKEPSYKFDVVLTPKARGHVYLNTGIYHDDWTTPELMLTALELDLGAITLGHHEGTVSEHRYNF